MTESLIVSKTGLAKTSAAVRKLATKLDHARQMRNERVARADADYVEAVRRALADIEPATTAIGATTEPSEPEAAQQASA